MPTGLRCFWAAKSCRVVFVYAIHNNNTLNFSISSVVAYISCSSLIMVIKSVNQHTHNIYSCKWTCTCTNSSTFRYFSAFMKKHLACNFVAYIFMPLFSILYFSVLIYYKYNTRSPPLHLRCSTKCELKSKELK